MSRDENIFSRWSSRKRAVAEENATDEKQAEEPIHDEAKEPHEGDEDEAVLLERLGLPSPESLGPGDDFSGFMQSGVPEFLRRRALRRLWRSNPVLANLDGLNDYDEDFTSPEETMKVLKTAYKVGRGFLTDKSEDDTEAEQHQLPDTQAPEAAVASAGTKDNALENDAGPLTQAESEDASEEGTTEEIADETGTSPDGRKNLASRVRRMRFET